MRLWARRHHQCDPVEEDIFMLWVSQRPRQGPAQEEALSEMRPNADHKESRQSSLSSVPQAECRDGRSSGRYLYPAEVGRWRLATQGLRSRAETLYLR